VDDVTFSHTGLYGGMSLQLQQRRCSVVNGQAVSAVGMPKAEGTTEAIQSIG